MKRTMIAGLLVTALAATAASRNGEPDLAWLAGAWCAERAGSSSEEFWMRPRGGLMLGMHRHTRGGRAAGFEFLRIELRAGTASYIAQPGGRAPTTFELRSADARSATFVNEEHDFPRRIRYERLDRSTLKARTDDGRDGGVGEEWIWSRCAPQDGF